MRRSVDLFFIEPTYFMYLIVLIHVKWKAMKKHTLHTFIFCFAACFIPVLKKQYAK